MKYFQLFVLFFILLFISCKKDPAKIYNTDENIIVGVPSELLKTINFQKDETIIDNIPNEYEVSIEKLSEYIISNVDKEPDIAYSIFYWITTNISYDYSLLTTEGFYFSWEDDVNSAETTFNRRQGVCDGYSRLYSVICEKSNIKTAYIYGYTPSVHTGYDDPLLYGQHAWNAVRIYNKWYLLDATWNWFITDPILFYETHLPYDEKWILF